MRRDVDVPDPILIHDDLELYLTARFRALLAARPEPVCSEVAVDRVEPDRPYEEWPAKLLVVRDDGTIDDELHVGQASIGLTVLAGTKRSPKVAKDLALIVRALIPLLPSPDPSNPIAAVLSVNGPYMVDEAPERARVYMTATLAVVARAV